MSRALSLVGVATALASCGWNHQPHQAEIYLDEPLWDAQTTVPTADGLYVLLPRAGALALVSPARGGSAERIDLGEGRVTRIDASPDRSTVVAFIERYACATTDPRKVKKIEHPDDCPRRDLEVTTEFALVAGGRVIAAEPLSGAYNQIQFSDDAKFAIAYLDFSEEIEVDSVLNLTGVAVIDLEAGTSQIVPVGFAADRVLFVEDELGATNEAVVLSRNAVAVVDLAAPVPGVSLTFPLTLDADAVVDPVDIDLTPDGRYALLSARGSSDLYALDLDVKAIRIVELAGAPGAMAVVDQPADRTVLVYPGLPVVELLDHQYLEPEPIALEESMDQIQLAGDQAILWTTSGNHDLYRIDANNGDLVEYRLQNPATGLFLSPTDEFALVLTRPEGFVGTGVDGVYDTHPGMEIVDLRTDRSEPFLLEGQGLGVAFSRADDGSTLNALVLQEGIDYLFRLDLYTRQTEEIELDAPPVAIGTMPDDTFYITHDSALGLVSFLDPSTGEVTSVGGFASLGSMDLVDLVAAQEAQ